MNIILINWNSGENDPFTLMNNNLKVMLEDYGCLVTVLEYDLEFSKKIFSIECERKVHLAITYQGIGSDLKITNEEICFWEYTKIPLLVLHSDHPSHNPINHAIDNIYVLHTYCLWPYNRYSNKNFIRNNPSLFLGTPSFYKENNTTEQKFNRDGDFFVFPKNLDDTKQLLYSYKKINPILYQIMEKLYHAIYDNFIFGDLLELHDVIDSNLDGALFEKLNYSLDRDTNRQLFHGIHSQADKFYRNIISEFVVDELKDYPLIINGRGWDFKEKNNKNHQFNPFGEAVNGEGQFFSNYGIIDVVPHMYSLHDRTLRAISYGTGFISNSRIIYKDKNGNGFEDLFYSGEASDLKNKVDNIVESPQRHRERILEFRNIFSENLKFEYFYHYIYLFACKFN